MTFVNVELLVLSFVLFAGTGTSDETCCHFQSSETCTPAWVEGGWNLYPTFSPSTDGLKYPIPSGDYEWAQGISGATLNSPLFTGITTNSTFEFHYYGDVDNASNSNIAVSFTPTTGRPTHLGVVDFDTDGSWVDIGFVCDVIPCCGNTPEPCDGTLQLETTVYDVGNPLFAVDDFETDYGCGF